MERLFRAWFRFALERPRGVLLAAAVALLFFGSFLPRIRFDNRPDAFVPADHPALAAKQRVEREFGLRDPILVAVVTERANGIFEPEPLRVIRDLSRRTLEHLRTRYPGRCVEHPVYSLATEYDVELEEGILHEAPFLDPFPETREELDALRDAVFRIELYSGVIVSDDGSAGAIIVLPPEGEAQAVNRWLHDRVAEARRPGLELAIAGEAAVRSSMGDAVTRDALRLNPVCGLIVTLFLVLAFRNLSGVLLPLLVVATGCVVMLGAMVLAGKPVYIITNSIVVTVMALGVADAIHVQGEFYDALGRAGDAADRKRLILEAMMRLRVPIFATSATDALGFVSFLLTSAMPPLRWYGLFTSIGILVTMTASFTLLPAGLALLDPRRPAQRRPAGWARNGLVAGGLARLGGFVATRPRRTALGCLLFLLAALLASSRLTIDQSMVSAFDEESEVAVADRVINDAFHGTYFLDVLLEKRGEGDLIDPEILGAIERLEEKVRRLPTVRGSISVAGFSRKLNQILHHWDEAENRIPADAGTIREHFSLLDASPSKEADLLRTITPDYRAAVVRFRLSSGWYRHERVVVDALADILAELFPPGGDVAATPAGRVNMDVSWVRLILRGHIASVACTLVIIFVFVALQFRSLAAAAVCLLCVLAGVVTTYAAMALLGIELSVGTSMFASLTIAVGVNFPMHVLHRLRARLRAVGEPEVGAYRRVFALTGKALVFNALAVCCGFLVLLVSELPLLRHFGLMIALGIGTSALTSLLLLPALSAWARPRFLYSERDGAGTAEAAGAGAD